MKTASAGEGFPRIFGLRNAPFDVVNEMLEISSVVQLYLFAALSLCADRLSNILVSET